MRNAELIRLQEEADITHTRVGPQYTCRTCGAVRFTPDEFFTHICTRDAIDAAEYSYGGDR